MSRRSSLDVMMQLLPGNGPPTPNEKRKGGRRRLQTTVIAKNVQKAMNDRHRKLWTKNCNQRQEETSVNSTNVLDRRTTLIEHVPSYQQVLRAKLDQPAASPKSKLRTNKFSNERALGSHRHYTDANLHNETPEFVYNTDVGPRKSIQASTRPKNKKATGSSVFQSSTERFISPTAMKLAIFQNKAKEPYADPSAIGPGTYRAKPAAIQIKDRYTRSSTFLNNSDRFEKVYKRAPEIELSTYDPPGWENKVVYLPTSPRFKSEVFPEIYHSSRVGNAEVPDIVYKVNNKYKATMEAKVKSSAVNYSTMRSSAARFTTEVAMRHNYVLMPNLRSNYGDQQENNKGIRQLKSPT